MTPPSASKGAVLVVDDERPNLITLKMQLEDEGYRAFTAQNAYKAIEILGEHHVDIVVTDLRMPQKDGLSLLADVRERWPEVDVIVVTAYGTIETAVGAMKAGARDYVTKPYRFDELLVRLGRIRECQRNYRELQDLRAQIKGRESYHGLVGRSPAMLAVFEKIEMGAPSDCTVLITGETGTGKELTARAIHKVSPRSNQPFVKVSCAALSPSVVESELFGHEEGAFTGAIKKRRGRFELAHEGTLFLDDIDDLPLGVQAKMLQALEDKSFERVGGEATLSFDVRIVAATKAGLRQEVDRGAFRRDLYYRLNVFTVELPPLRERREDVPLLTAHFMAQAAADRGWPKIELEPEVMKILTAYSWPGNVRQLQNALAQATVLLKEPNLQPCHLPSEVSVDEDADHPVRLFLEGRSSIDWPAESARLEARLYEWALERAGGSQTKAAQILCMPRTTLRYRLEALESGRLPAVQPGQACVDG